MTESQDSYNKERMAIRNKRTAIVLAVIVLIITGISSAPFFLKSL